MEIKWKVINEDYLNYLRNGYESRIPFSDYGSNKYKPFFGSLFDIGEIAYVTQISHPQQRHIKLKKNIDFYKIYHPNDGRLIAVINLNYMFPIYKSLLIDLEYKNIEIYRTFINEEEKSKYIDLLRFELKKINELSISKNAIKIYNLKYDFPDSDVAKRCFDFKELENACQLYIDNLNITRKEIAVSKD